MAKINQKFVAGLNKNTEKGGAWLASYSIVTDGNPDVRFRQTAWANASAGKRWIKAMVEENTPRKSVKMVDSGKIDEKNKPISFNGELIYKVEA
jgi:ribosomal 30S subunit maturation factor RimM